jgi:hypothetical protein
MQIAGSKCKICGHGIVLSTEGKFCRRCETVFHTACEPADTCAICGQRYEAQAPIKPDPLREALLPRALRPAKSGGPALAVAALIAFALLSLIAGYVTQLLMSDGH